MFGRLVFRTQITSFLRIGLALAASLPAVSRAAELALPQGAALTREVVEPAGTYALPTGPWQETGGVPAETLEGRITRQAWRIGGSGLSSYQILLTLRQQLLDAGYEIGFECEDTECGGFDFRYGTDVIGEPEMHVDLGDYHFLTATRPGEAPDAVSLMVSRSASSGFVQVIGVGAAEALPVATSATTAATKAVAGSAMPATISGDIGPAMEAIGRFVLADLVFATGSSELGPGRFTSLDDLAAYLGAHPEKRVALVGHTDAEGSLTGNISLSKRRAASVADRLVNEYGVNPDQLEAEGIGYLAPIASNQSDEGRTRNRRVEAILISTE